MADQHANREFSLPMAVQAGPEQFQSCLHGLLHVACVVSDQIAMTFDELAHEHLGNAIRQRCDEPERENRRISTRRTECVDII
jgi:hypothetical protein